MFEWIMKHFSLTTFGEGGGAAGAGGAAGGDGSAGEGTAAPGESGADATAKTGKGGRTAAAAEDLSKVQYGKQDEAEQQPEAEEEKPAEPEPEKPAKRQTFDEFLKSDPENQRELQKRIDQAINRRFAKTKAAEEQNARLMPALNLLATKYGVQAGDTEALINAINGDSDLIEQQAMDAGMEPDAYREFQKLKAENEAFKQAEAERQRQEQTQQALAEWKRQGDELKLVYPGFDLAREAQNEQFAQMLGAGVSVRAAYEVVHMEEIQRGLIRNAAADAQKETIAKIQQKSNRPREGAAGKSAAATVKADPTKFTTRDFDEIMRRAQRGERIRF